MRDKEKQALHLLLIETASIFFKYAIYYAYTNRVQVHGIQSLASKSFSYREYSNRKYGNIR